MRKVLLTTFIIFFMISICFPIVASLMNKEPEPDSLIGSIDAGIALILAALYITIYSTKKSDDHVGSRTITLKAFNTLCTLPLLLLLLYFVDAPIHWDVLLIGLSWRVALLSFVLQDLFSLLKQPYRQHKAVI
jgi:hypothetical protein